MSDWDKWIANQKDVLTEYVAKTTSWNKNDPANWENYKEEAQNIVNDFINKNLVVKEKESKK